MKVAFDTNIVLDAILRRGNYAPAQELIYKAASDEIVGVITANSITDIYYIARKIVGDEDARKAIYDILALFDVAAVDGEACATALGLPMTDYEDAVLAACAYKESADYIVTRDEGLLKAEGCPMPTVRPEELLNTIG